MFTALVFGTSCDKAASVAPDTTSTAEGSPVFKDWTPTEPESVEAFFEAKPNYDKNADGKVENAEVLSFFPNEAVQVSVRDRTVSGEVTAPVVGVSAKGHSYTVVVDYVKYQTERANCEQVKPGHDCDRLLRTGVGIRLNADVTTLEADINLSSLFGIAAAAALNQVRGTLRFETIGITGPGISPLVPLPSQISPDSVQGAMQAAAAIKAKLHDQDGSVQVSPQVFAQKLHYVPTGTATGAPPEDKGGFKPDDAADMKTAPSSEASPPAEADAPTPEAAATPPADETEAPQG